MLPIESLEHRMATVMRTGLRKAMAYVDVGDVNNPLREVKASLESVLHNELRKQITITYAEGYIHGGYLIRKNAPKGTMLSAAAELLREDPRIIKATKEEQAWLLDDLCRTVHTIEEILTLVQDLSDRQLTIIDQLIYKERLQGLYNLRKKSFELAEKITPADVVIVIQGKKKILTSSLVYGLFQKQVKITCILYPGKRFTGLSFRISSIISSLCIPRETAYCKYLIEFSCCSMSYEATASSARITSKSR